MSLIRNQLKWLRQLEHALRGREPLHEGKDYWVDSKSTIRFDNPTHGAGQKHAHISRRGQPVGILNKDGTSSHGTGPFKISKSEAKLLADRGFIVPVDRLVENLDERARNFLFEKRLER